MRRDLKERMRQRVRARLDELGMSGREVALSVRPRPFTEDHQEWQDKIDSWWSSIMTGRAALSWEYVDAVCAALRISVSELVRDDDTELRELTPSEMRLLRYYQNWPRAVQDRWLKLLEYFESTSLEPDKARWLDEVEELSPQEQRELHQYLFALKQGRLRQTDEHASGPHAIESGGSTSRSTMHPDPQGRRLPATPAQPDDDPEK